MDADTLARLSSGEGWDLLQSLPPYDEQQSLALGARLRKAGFDAALVAAALTQSRLRARATSKFGALAADLLFTSDGLEQATRLEVAARHAHRYATTGHQVVNDLGCGVGSDAMALAGLDLGVVAVDSDPVTAAVAAVNLRHWPTALVRCARAEDVTLPTHDSGARTGVWLDPARRLPGVTDRRGRTRRVFSLEAISPSWQYVLAVAQAVPATGVKLSPGLAHAAIPPGTEAQWTSWHGEVLECAVWWGPLAVTTGRTAAVCTENETHTVTEAEAADSSEAPTLASLTHVGGWLYEPDRAVIRAGLTGALVGAVDGAELDTGVGYVSSDTASEVPWAKRFTVVEAMPLAIKPLARWLREHGHDRVTIKKRGVALDADQLRRQLKMTGRGKGGSEATLVLTRIAGAQVALVVDPA